MSLPTPKVEIAFTTQPNDPSPVWVDVTSYVRNVTDNIQTSRGRQDQYATIQPSSLSLTLINKDGRFTPGNTSSPYYPNVKKGRKIRVSVTWNGVTYTRFTGYIDEWPVAWADASATVADVKIAATSRMALLGRGATLPSIIQLEYLADVPIAYYPLSDSAGSLNAGNVAPTVQASMAVTAFGGGLNSNVTFGNPGPSTSSDTAASFTRVSATAGAYLAATIQGFNSGIDQSITLEAVVQAGTAQEMGLAQVDDGTGARYLTLGINASGKLTATYFSATGFTYTITSSATVTDGAVHHAAIRQTTIGNTTGTLFLDGAPAGTATIGASQFAMPRMIAGGGIVNSAYAGTVSNVAIYSGAPLADARILAHANAVLNGFSGEASGNRIYRLAIYAGVPDNEIDFEAGLSTSIAAQDTAGQIPLQLMQDVTATEGGVLFDSGDGLLTFQGRSHRYNAVSALTITSELQPSLQPKLDDQDLVNDITASRSGGVSLRVVDSASVSDYGTYQTDLQLLTTSDNEVADAAAWRVYTSSTPQVKVPVAEVELLAASSAQKAAILSREIGDRITLSGLPSQAPASTMDFFIEGWTETITANTHSISFNLSNATNSGVWQLDSSVYSVLNSTTRMAY